MRGPGVASGGQTGLSWGGALGGREPQEGQWGSEWREPRTVVGGSSDLEQQLKDMGFAVWRDPGGEGVHATFSGEFVVMRRVGLFLALVCSISLGAILAVSNSTLLLTQELPLGCWRTGAELLAAGYRGRLNSTFKETVTCPWRCFEHLNTELDAQDIKGGNLTAPGSAPYWGWNEVYGGRLGPMSSTP